jgi:hypothetical protein
VVLHVVIERRPYSLVGLIGNTLFCFAPIHITQSFYFALYSNPEWKNPEMAIAYPRKTPQTLRDTRTGASKRSLFPRSQPSSRVMGDWHSLVSMYPHPVIGGIAATTIRPPVGAPPQSAIRRPLLTGDERLRGLTSDEAAIYNGISSVNGNNGNTLLNGCTMEIGCAHALMNGNVPIPSVDSKSASLIGDHVLEIQAWECDQGAAVTSYLSCHLTHSFVMHTNLIDDMIRQ